MTAFPLPFGIPKFDAAVAEIETLDDRGAAIVAASLLEEHLIEAIKTRFKQSDKCVEGEFMKGYGPLASFKARIDLGFLLGFYDLQCRNRMIRVKEVRNKFAHSLKPLSFEHQEIRDVCAHLPTIEDMAAPWLKYKTIMDDPSVNESKPKHMTISELRRWGDMFVDYYTNAKKDVRTQFVTYIQCRTTAMITIIGGKDHLDVAQDFLHI